MPLQTINVLIVSKTVISAIFHFVFLTLYIPPARMFLWNSYEVPGAILGPFIFYLPNCQRDEHAFIHSDEPRIIAAWHMPHATLNVIC